MIGPVSGGVRTLRSLVLTLVTLGLAAAAHRVGGGELPAAWVLLGIGVALLGPAALLTARRLRAPLALAWLGLLEWGLHHVLAVLAAPLPSSGGAAIAATGHAHGGAAAAAQGASAGTGTGGLGPMIGAHAVATVVTALALAYAERALWAMWEALRPALVALPRLRQTGVAPLPCAVGVLPVMPLWAGPTGSRAPPGR